MTDRRAEVTVDLGQVDMVDSTGLGVLAAARRVARSWGHRLTVVRPRASIRRAMEATGLADAIEAGAVR